MLYCLEGTNIFTEHLVETDCLDSDNHLPDVSFGHSINPSHAQNLRPIGRRLQLMVVHDDSLLGRVAEWCLETGNSERRQCRYVSIIYECLNGWTYAQQVTSSTLTNALSSTALPKPLIHIPLFFVPLFLSGIIWHCSMSQEVNRHTVCHTGPVSMVLQLWLLCLVEGGFFLMCSTTIQQDRFSAGYGVILSLSFGFCLVAFFFSG